MTARRPAAPRPSARGFTMIELMVAIAIVAILAGLGVPLMRQSIDFITAKSVAVELAGDLRMARGEALKRNTSVTVTPIGGSWNTGWQVKTAAGTLLSEHRTSRTGISVSAPTAGVTFAASGRIDNTDASPSDLKWLVDTATHSGKRCVRTGVTGAAHIQLGDC